jgi:hypothetical protein
VMQIVPENECVGAANDAGGLQFGRDAAGGVAGMQKHELLRGRRYRRHEGPSEPAACSEDSEQ